MSTKIPVRGKVAKIVNTREIVINRGSADGVSRGMIFAVLDSNLDSIVDPDSGEVLGGVERSKILVKAVEVHERLTIAKTFQFIWKGGTAMTGISSLFEPRRKVYNTIAIDDQTWEDITEEESFVKVGDPVKEVELEEG